MNDSFDQHTAHRPSVLIGSRQEAHRWGSATSTRRPNTARSAPAKRPRRSSPARRSGSEISASIPPPYNIHDREPHNLRPPAARAAGGRRLWGSRSWMLYGGGMDAEISLPDRRAGLDRLGRFAGALRAVFGRLVDVALPHLCASCREPISTEGLCAVCWSKLSFIAPPDCERLGIPFPYDPGPGVISIEAIADPPAYRRARAAVRYGDVASTLVHGLKYGDRLDLAPLMGRWMANAGRDLLAEADAMVPVPLHWRRHWARRFNQAEAL